MFRVSKMNKSDRRPSWLSIHQDLEEWVDKRLVWDRQECTQHGHKPEQTQLLFQAHLNIDHLIYPTLLE